MLGRRFGAGCLGLPQYVLIYAAATVVRGASLMAGLAHGGLQLNGEVERTVLYTGHRISLRRQRAPDLLTQGGLAGRVGGVLWAMTCRYTGVVPALAGLLVSHLRPSFPWYDTTNSTV